MIYTKEQDIEFMKSIARGAYAAAIVKNYGEERLPDISVLTDTISIIYKYVNLSDDFNILAYTTTNEQKSLRNTHIQLAIKLTDLSFFASKSSKEFVVEIVSENEIWVILDCLIDPKSLVEDSIVYQYRNGTESIYEKNQKTVDLTRPPDLSSYFSFPTFKQLDAALEHYRIVCAQRSKCPYISSAWLNSNKLFFSPKPEKKLRQSLYNYLSSHLRAEVREEQNMNDSEPVDIKITWEFSSHIAIIEIKWIGKSIEYIGKSSFNQNYNEKRANEGARQLSDYLDENKRYTPQKFTMGYLVVYDVRRWGTNEKTVTINRLNGFHYENREIKYDPNFHTERIDFAKPVRFFLEPHVTI